MFDRVPSPKKLVTLRGVDHMHFITDAQATHERVRSMTFPPELAWLQQEIRPFAQLRPAAEAHVLVRGLTLAHFDATLKNHREAQEFMDTYPPFA